MNLTITFLGTGTSQGVPIIGSTHPVCLSTNKKDKRLRSSILITHNKNNYVIDCGPDFRQQMLNANCKCLDALIFTHEHADHTAGLDDIRPFYFNQGNINVYAKKRVFKALKKRFDYIFKTKNKYPGTPSINLFYIKNKPFTINNLDFIPIKGKHNKLTIFGYRCLNFAYLTDMSFISETELQKLKNLNVLVINALRHKPHLSHFTLNEALELIAFLKPKQAYLTHISHLLGFHDNIQETLPKHVYLAYDNLKITV